MGFFTLENYKQALTMGIGSIIICSIMFQDAVELEFDTFIPPALALVLWTSFCPVYSGMATLLYPVVAVGSILGIAAYLIIIYGTYAATGPDYSPRTEKGVSMAIIGTAVVAVLHLIRVRFPAFDLSGMLAQLLSTVIAFLAYWSASVSGLSSNIWLFFVLLAIPAVTGSLVSMFIVPNPAGKKCFVLFGQLLETTAHLQSEVIEKLLLAEGKDGGENKDLNNNVAVVDIGMLSASNQGTASNVVPEEGRYVGVAAELEPIVLPIHKLDIQAWQLAVGINGLLSLAAVEIDVYNKQHIFPGKEFRTVVTPVRIMEHIFISIVSFLEHGKWRNSKVFLLLKTELEEFRAAVEMNCKTLKQVVVDGYEYERGLMECVPRLEAACLALKEKMTENEKAQSSGDCDTVLSDEFLVAHELVSLIVLAGKEVPSAWEKLPALIAVRQPAAAAVAELFFAEKNKSTSGEAEKSLSAEKESQNLDSSASVISQPLAAATAPETTKDSFKPPPPPFREVFRPEPHCNSFRRKLYLASISTGIHSWHWKIVLHITVVFAISAILNVIPAVRVALHNKAYWIIITVMAIGDITTGGIVDNGVQRMAGTALGSAGIAILAGLAYLANGSSYIGSSVGKKVTQAAIVTLWMSIMKLFGSKYSPRMQKFFIIATLVVPLIALLDATGEDVWLSTAFRVANTCIGVCIYTLGSFIVFPVTVGDHIKEKTADCLLQVADMLEGIAALPLMSASPPASSLDGSSTLKNNTKERSACFGLRNRKTEEPSSPSSTPVETDIEAAADSDEPAVSTEKEQETRVFPQQEEDAGSVAAKSIINNGIQKAGTSLMDIIKLRDIADKEYLVSKLYYLCTRKLKSSSSVSTSPVPSSEPKEINPEDQHLDNQEDHQSQHESLNCGKFSFLKKRNSRPPLQVYLLDQLVSHLKHNIVYSVIALRVREWLRTEDSFFAKDPEVAYALRAFVQQSAECFRGLRLAILGLSKPGEALQTVLTLREMTSDIGQICKSSEHCGSQETTVVHTMLMTCRNIELLFRATDRALVTRDEPGVVSVTDQKLGKNEFSILALLNVEATSAAVQAVTVEEGAAADAVDKKGGAGKARDGVKELAGMIRTANI